jgi:predicted glutamine amidotransferase
VAQSPGGWGVGFYQGGEVLLRRRPLDTADEIELHKLCENLNTDLLVGHVRHPTVGNLRTENTHPFRYRQWLFAQTGTLDKFDGLRDRLLAMQPSFLRPNVRGDTDSELMFYLFLSCLHDLGELDESSVPPPQIRTALQNAHEIVVRLCGEQGTPVPTGDTLLTNGDHLIGLHLSGHMAYRVVNKAEAAQQLLAGDRDSHRLSHLGNAHCTVIASQVTEPPGEWQRLPNQCIATLSRTSAPEVRLLTTPEESPVFERAHAETP